MSQQNSKPPLLLLPPPSLLPPPPRPPSTSGLAGLSLDDKGSKQSRSPSQTRFCLVCTFVTTASFRRVAHSRWVYAVISSCPHTVFFQTDTPPQDFSEVRILSVAQLTRPPYAGLPFFSQPHAIYYCSSTVIIIVITRKTIIRISFRLGQPRVYCQAIRGF